MFEYDKCFIKYISFFKEIVGYIENILYFCGKKDMLFTIVTINYNNKEGLYHTIESVLGQSFHDFEFVVIDGGSTDGSVEVIKEFQNMMSYWISEKDSGIYNAMNKGVAKAHGDYCIFMNSGDCFYDKNVLEQVAENMTNEDVIVGKVAIDDKNTIISPPPLDGELTLYHLYSGAIPHQGSFIRKELLQRYPYDESLKISSDWKFFIQTLILDNCSVNFLDLFVARYDLDGVSTSNPMLMRAEKDEILARLLPPRIIADYKKMKQSECLTQLLTPSLKKYYTIDKVVFKLAKLLLTFKQIMA